MNHEPDPAAIFACAKSLHEACIRRSEQEPGLCLSDAYNGMDQFMRELMRVGDLFENWCCEHVEFEAMEEVWSYLLEERFGAVCLEVVDAASFMHFDRDDCLRVAFKLQIPLRADGSIPVPVCVDTPNRSHAAGFVRLRIQTVREELGEDGQMAAFTEADEPFDENYGPPFFGIYGVHGDDLLEHIADRTSYDGARALMLNLMPELRFPARVIAFGTTNFTDGLEEVGSA